MKKQWEQIRTYSMTGGSCNHGIANVSRSSYLSLDNKLHALDGGSARLGHRTGDATGSEVNKKVGLRHSGSEVID